MKITDGVQISTAHRMGAEGDNRPLVVKVKDAGMKGVIYSQLKLLKGKNIYVNDQIPEEVGETKRRE